MDDGADVSIRWVRHRKKGHIPYGTMAWNKRFLGKWHAKIDGEPRTCCGRYSLNPMCMATSTKKRHLCERCRKAIVTLHKAMSAMCC